MLRKQSWFLINPLKIKKYTNKKNLRLHLGCSVIRLKNFVNVDVRYTPATDVTMDLNHVIFQAGSVAVAFSHAFFEHLYRGERIHHLKGIYHSLNEKTGFICYIGLPYFKNIARFYLEKAPGTAGPVFDLFNVYRYTHGDPDRMLKEGWYFEQLHKSLFDEEELEYLLQNAGFRNFVIFSYAFSQDQNPMAVNIGFYATKVNKGRIELQNDSIQFLKQVFARSINFDTLEFIGLNA